MSTLIQMATLEVKRKSRMNLLVEILFPNGFFPVQTTPKEEKLQNSFKPMSLICANQIGICFGEVVLEFLWQQKWNVAMISFNGLLSYVTVRTKRMNKETFINTLYHAST